MARGDGINRTFARNVKFGEGAVAARQGHNERQNKTYSNCDVVQSRSYMNVHYKEPAGDYADMFAQMVADKKISTRGLKPDADHYCEMVFDVNSAYFHNHGGYEFAKQFYQDAYDAAVKIVGGEDYILSAVMHADERNVSMSEALGYDVWHYHLHVVYIPVVEKQIKWTKRCKDPALVGTVKETIMQVSASKKWQSDAALDENGNPLRDKQGKLILKKSYSLLQDAFYEHMHNAGYTDVERGEKGSSEEHLTTLQFKVMKEQERLTEAERQKECAEHEAGIARQQAADAFAQADKAQAHLLDMEEKADKVKQTLDKWTDEKKDVLAMVNKYGKPEELVPEPPKLMTPTNYRNKIVIPALKEFFNFFKHLAARYIKLQGDVNTLRKQLRAEKDTTERLSDAAAKYSKL
ncbi:MAG: plasmid recombination protein [Clostridia bacterium]|nr:plasmid recombination protein [Clostridia bacterium]